VYSNLHVSTAVYCLVRMTGYFFQFENAREGIFMGLSTFVSYNFIRYVNFLENKLTAHINSWFAKHLKLLFCLTVFDVLWLLLLSKSFHGLSFLLLLPFVVLTAMYGLPLLKYKGESISLRGFPSLKIVSIAFSWAGLSVLFPLVSQKIPISFLHGVFFMQQFLFVLVLTLPFDIRDLGVDEKRLKTVPQLLGVQKTKYLGMGLLLLFVGISYLTMSLFFFWHACIGAFLVGVFLLLSNKKQAHYFASFWVEGIPIVWYSVTSLSLL
jgi:hypothetical protein